MELENEEKMSTEEKLKIFGMYALIIFLAAIMLFVAYNKGVEVGEVKGAIEVCDNQGMNASIWGSDNELHCGSPFAFKEDTPNTFKFNMSQ